MSLLGLLLVAAASGPKMGDTNLAAIDTVVTSAMSELRIPGVAVAIIRSGKPEMVKGYGFSDTVSKAPVTPSTRFQIASLMKPFTAIAILKLVEQKKIGLQDPASKYLTWLPAQYKNVTIERLLTHTSGVPSDVRTSNEDDFTLATFRDRISSAPTAFKPGARWQYANSGYILLSMILEQVSGQPLSTHFRDAVFLPAGMKDSSLAEPGKPLPFTGYAFADGAFSRSPYFSGGFGAGAGISTLNDLVAWDTALRKGAILQPGSKARMFTPAIDDAGKPIQFEFRGESSGYGFGWFLTSYKGHRLQTHGGVLSGFSSTADQYPDDDVSIIVLCNAKSGADRIGYSEVVARRVADAVLALKASPADEIRKVIQNWDDALVRGDIDFVANLLHDDFLYVTGDGSTFSKSRLLTSLRQTGKLVSSTSRIATIHIVGDTAIAIAEGSLETMVGGKLTKEEYRYTDVFQRTKGGWKAILTQIAR